MDPRRKSEVVESPVGYGSGLILFELRCLYDHTLGPLSAHLAHIENKVITIRIAPIRAEHRHEPPAARLIDLFYIMARCDVSQTLPCVNLFDAKFDWRGQEYFLHMPDTGHTLVAYVAVVMHLSVVLH